MTSLTEFALIVCLFIFYPDGDLIEFETCCRKNMVTRLFIIECEIYWTKYCIIL